MPKFEVTLTWSQYLSGTVVIEAEDEDQAEQIAEDNKDDLYQYLIEYDMVNDDNDYDDLEVSYIDEADDDAEVDWPEKE